GDPPGTRGSTAMTRKTSESASSCGNHISIVEPIEPIKTKVSCGWSLLRGPYSTKCNCAMCLNLPFLQPLPCPGHHRCTWWPGPSCHLHALSGAPTSPTCERP